MERQGPRAAAKLTLMVFLAMVASGCRTTRPAPPPAPEQPARVVRWEIAPAEGYQLDSGYVTVDYVAWDALREDYETEARPDDASDEPPPIGGRLTVHLGYRELRDANTLWYRFEVSAGPQVWLSFDGEDNIPNVKGADGYWWNDLDIDLEQEVTREILLVVTDTRHSVSWSFTLSRVEDSP